MAPQPGHDDGRIIHSGWQTVAGAVFGAITLAGSFYYAISIQNNPAILCSFRAFSLAFSLGCALSVAFIGGGAALQGRLPTIPALVVGAGGGVAVLVILLMTVPRYAPECRAAEIASSGTQPGFVDVNFPEDFSSLSGQLEILQRTVADLDEILRVAVRESGSAEGQAAAQRAADLRDEVLAPTIEKLMSGDKVLIQLDEATR